MVLAMVDDPLRSEDEHVKQIREKIKEKNEEKTGTRQDDGR